MSARRTDAKKLAPAPAARFTLPKPRGDLLSEPERARLLGFVRDLLAQPTAPYFEDGPLGVVRRFAAERPGLVVREDAHANLIVTWPGTRRRRGARALAFSAHLDHPGFHGPVRRGRAHFAELHGGVARTSLPGAPVRFFDPRTRRAIATARIRASERRDDDVVVCELDSFVGRAARGAFGVFDLTDGIVRGSRLHARVCDDLIGAAAILATLDALARAEHTAQVSGIFTRAEETGFVGCIALLESGALGRDTAVIGLECSPRRATAKVGRGPVIRVGDKQSVFDPELTQLLQRSAARLASRHPGFVAQRALMDGGSCESTAYNAFGVRAGAACLALGNYHNQGPKSSIASEFVDWNDLEGLVALLVESALAFDDDESGELKLRLHRSFERELRRLEASTQRLTADEKPTGRGSRR